MKPYDLMEVALIVQKMRGNSAAWHSAGEDARQALEASNRDLANQLAAEYGIPVVYNPDGGTWRVGDINGPLLYGLY